MAADAGQRSAAPTESVVRAEDSPEQPAAAQFEPDSPPFGDVEKLVESRLGNGNYPNDSCLLWKNVLNFVKIFI